MKKKPLNKTNPHLRDTQKTLDMIRRAVESSSAIEGVDKKLPPNWWKESSN